jgi:hypothetical protein
MKGYTDSVSPELLALLRDVMGNPDFDSFILGGGTSLSLRFGHRSSIDIDLFSTKPFDSKKYADILHVKFSGVERLDMGKGSQPNRNSC